MNEIVIRDKYLDYQKVFTKKLNILVKIFADEQYADVVKNVSKAFYAEGWNKINKSCYSIKDAHWIDERLSKSDGLYRLAKKNNVNRKNRVVRFRQLIDKMIDITMVESSYQVYFTTITFRDDVLDNTTELTRRRYISRLLKPLSYYYIANIDYGKTTEREHYHAVVLIKDSNNIDFIVPNDYGFTSCELVRTRDSIQLAKYMTKIKNHAFKKSANERKILYARKKDLLLLHSSIRHLLDAMSLFGDTLTIV